MQTIQQLKFVKREVPSWSRGTVAVPGGTVYRLSPEWTRADYWGMIRSRIGAFRMTYSVPPGLYAMGEPSQDSDVFVTANYKLSFDIVRRELKGLNAWILVLDTKSINVWCAAGKGTFGTDELVDRMAAAHLDRVVEHRRIILPQLGAVGVNAADVQKRTGFRVFFGPVLARDIRAYVQAGRRKTKEMRTMPFSVLDRLVLTPMELNPALKKSPWFVAGILILFGLQPSGILFRDAWTNGFPFLCLLFLAILSGAFVTPLFLPFVPFRSFAIKGWIIGLALTSPVAWAFGLGRDPLLIAAASTFFPALSSYVALQFTGSTTFTGMSGVKKELRIGIPVYLGAAAATLILLGFYKAGEWRGL